MVTLGVVLVVTATVDFLGGSGPIAILLFGIVLGNCGEIPFLSGPAACGVIEETIKFFHGEVTFFIRTFFFVYIGMLMTPAVLSPRYLGISVALFLIIAAMRYLASSLWSGGREGIRGPAGPFLSCIRGVWPPLCSRPCPSPPGSGAPRISSCTPSASSSSQHPDDGRRVPYGEKGGGRRLAP
jgi:hypothetical protein